MSHYRAYTWLRTTGLIILVILEFIAPFATRFRGARPTQRNHCQLSKRMQKTRFISRVMVHYSGRIGTLNTQFLLFSKSNDAFDHYNA